MNADFEPKTAISGADFTNFRRFQAPNHQLSIINNQSEGPGRVPFSHDFTQMNIAAAKPCRIWTYGALSRTTGGPLMLALPR